MIHTFPRRWRQVRQALVSFGALAVLTTASCQTDRPTSVAPVDPDTVDMSPLDAAAPVITPTYDGSGESVHPDFAAPPLWWRNRQSYLAFTPYPAGDVKRENPSLLASSDVMHWHAIDGAPNPIVFPSSGYLSDPDIVFNPERRELWMYYRSVNTQNVIKLIRSSDGAKWSAPADVVHGVNHTIVSPAVVRRGPADWLMWAVNAGPMGCSAPSTQIEVRQSTNGRDWSAPRSVDMPTPAYGYSPWHIDVQWIPSRSEYWAVFNAKSAESCGTTVLFLSTSKDGEIWETRPTPLLVAGEIPALDAVVYRTTFAYDPKGDLITFWYSGGTRRTKTGNIAWHTVAHRMTREAAFARTGGNHAMRRRRIPPSVKLSFPP